MSGELTKLMLGVVSFGVVGGYAFTVWGTRGAAASVALALAVGLVKGHYWKR